MGLKCIKKGNQGEKHESLFPGEDWHTYGYRHSFHKNTHANLAHTLAPTQTHRNPNPVIDSDIFPSLNPTSNITTDPQLNLNSGLSLSLKPSFHPQTAIEKW